MILLAFPFIAWVVYEVSTIRPLRENVDHMRERLDAIYAHLLGDDDLRDK